MSKINELLYEIETWELVLPEFQREYVWNKTQAKELMVSLIKDYPTGGLLFWTTSNPPEIKNWIDDSEEIGRKNIILDGQQRLTTLYLLLKNKIPPYYSSADIKEDPRELYFNLETADFQYFQASVMGNNPSWVSVVDCFQDRVNISLIADQKTDGNVDEYRYIITKLIENHNRIRAIEKLDYPIQIVPNTASIVEAIDIFDRVNSQGTKLTDADLALTHVCAKWPPARRIFKKKIYELEERDFNFDLNFMVRCLTGIVEGSAIFEKIHKTEKDDLIKGWELLDSTLDYLVNILPNHAYIHSTEDLNTSNILVPVVVYLSRKNNQFNDQSDLNRCLYWIYNAHIWQRYSGQTDQRLDHDISLILRNPNPWAALVNEIIDMRGRIEVKPSDFEGRGTMHPLYRMTNIICKAYGATDWLNGSPIYETYGEKYQINSHHIFPTSLLYKIGGYSPDNHIHKKRVNEIANRAFISKRTNQELSNKPPKETLKIVANKFPSALEKHLIPNKPELWEMDMYEDFLRARKEILSDSINQYLNLLWEPLADSPEIPLEDMIALGEATNLEFKASMRYDLRLEKVNKDLQKIIAKTISAFMNSEGGTLLIGILDDGSTYGIENDIQTLSKKDVDGFTQTLYQTLVDYIGVEYSGYVKTKFVDRENKTVCIVYVEKSQRPAYLKNGSLKEFFIRVGNSSRPLNIEEAHEYIDQRFQ